jgi:hypothetical protein
MSAIAQVHDSPQCIGFKHVLMATDFSDASERALAYALAIAHRYSCALSVVYAIQPEPREQIPMEPLPRDPRQSSQRYGGSEGEGQARWSSTSGRGLLQNRIPAAAGAFVGRDHS